GIRAACMAAIRVATIAAHTTSDHRISASAGVRIEFVSALSGIGAAPTRAALVPRFERRCRPLSRRRDSANVPSPFQPCPRGRGADQTMKLTIERAALLKALGHVQSVVERRNTIPILSNVLISAGRDEVSFSATDLDMEIIDEAPARVEVPGQITAPAHTLY